MASKDAMNLDFDDEVKITCGQVFLTRKNVLILSCALCHEKCNTFPNFIRHLSIKHFHSPLLEAENVEMYKTNTMAPPKYETVDHSYMEAISPLDIDLSLLNEIKYDPEFIPEPTKASATHDDNNKECTEIEGSARKESKQIHTHVNDNTDNIEEQNLQIDLFVLDEMEDGPEFIPEPTKASATHNENNKEATQHENSVRKEPKQIRTLRRSNRLSKTHINYEENIKAYDDSDKGTTQIEDSVTKKPKQIRTLRRYKGVAKTHVNYVKENIQAYDDNDKETRQSEDSAGKEAEQIGTVKSYNRMKDVEEYLARKKYFCENCNAGFSFKSSLSAHKKKHTGIKSHGCSFCEKKFFTRVDLQIHVRTHTGERPFVCKTCGKKFISTSNLAQHMLIHTVERKYVCKICNATFKNSSALYVHRKIHDRIWQ